MLLVEEGWHATLYLARSLEAAGYAVTVLTANGTTASCRHRTVRWMSGPSIGSAALVTHLERLLTETAFDHVIPLTEAAMAQLWATPGRWSDRLFPTVERWQQLLVLDKHALVEHLRTRGIPVPRQLRIDLAFDREAAIRELGLPLVVKGSTGSAGRRVRIVERRDELDEVLQRASALGGDWAVQEFLSGPTYLVGGVFRAGEPLRLYGAEKLEQYPAVTGGAIALRSTRERELVELGTRAARELQWTGFASADVMRGRDGRLRLLEINPRLWGSLAGARSAGVDLFAPFAELLAGGSPKAELDFAADDECWIFPRYLNSAHHRNLAGARRALRDLFGDQGRDWLNPAFAIHIMRRLYSMPRMSGL